MENQQSKNVILSRDVDKWHIVIENNGKNTYSPTLQNLGENVILRIISHPTKPKTTRLTKEVETFDLLVNSDGQMYAQLKEWYDRITEKSAVNSVLVVSEPVQKTSWEKLQCNGMEEDFMITILSSQYKMKDPVYLAAVGPSGTGKSYTLDLFRNSALLCAPMRVTTNYWLPGTSDIDSNKFSGFGDSLGKCFAIDEASILFSEKPDDANKVYAQLLGTYGKNEVEIGDPGQGTHKYGDSEKRPCSMILCMTDDTYNDNYKRWMEAGYRFVARYYPPNQSMTYIDGLGIVIDGNYVPVKDTTKTHGKELVDHIFNTKDKYLEMIEPAANIIETIEELSKQMIILSKIWYGTIPGPSRLASILVHIVQLRAMLHDRPPDDTDVQYAEKFTCLLVSYRDIIKRFGDCELRLIESVPHLVEIENDVEVCKPLKKGQRSESEFYDNAKNIKGLNHLDRIINTDDGTIMESWRLLFKRLEPDIWHWHEKKSKGYKKKEKKPNFVEYSNDNEEPTSDVPDEIIE